MATSSELASQSCMKPCEASPIGALDLEEKLTAMEAEGLSATFWQLEVCFVGTVDSEDPKAPLPKLLSGTLYACMVSCSKCYLLSFHCYAQAPPTPAALPATPLAETQVVTTPRASPTTPPRHARASL